MNLQLNIRDEGLFLEVNPQQKFGILPFAIAFTIEFRPHQQAQYVKLFVQ